MTIPSMKHGCRNSSMISHQGKASTCGSFPSWLFFHVFPYDFPHKRSINGGYPLSSSIFSRFPWNKPSSYWSSLTMETPMFRPRSSQGDVFLTFTPRQQAEVRIPVRWMGSSEEFSWWSCWKIIGDFHAGNGILCLLRTSFMQPWQCDSRPSDAKHNNSITQCFVQILTYKSHPWFMKTKLSCEASFKFQQLKRWKRSFRARFPSNSKRSRSERILSIQQFQCTKCLNTCKTQ